MTNLNDLFIVKETNLKFLLICANVRFSPSILQTSCLPRRSLREIHHSCCTWDDQRSKGRYRAGRRRRAIARLAKNRQSDGLIRARLFVGAVGRFGIAAKTVLSYSERLKLPEVGTSNSAKGG